MSIGAALDDDLVAVDVAHDRAAFPRFLAVKLIALCHRVDSHIDVGFEFLQLRIHHILFFPTAPALFWAPILAICRAVVKSPAIAPSEQKPFLELLSLLRRSDLQFPDAVGSRRRIGCDIR